MTRVVVAVDSFKGSIPAAAAAAALAEGWRRVDPASEVLLRPMADGGEGTLDAFAAAVVGARRMPVTVRGPHGRDVDAAWLLLPDGTGAVELASTSGIELLGDRRRPWDAGTTGFGQAIAAALDHGVRRLVVGIGSSASTDGGAGMLAALGARLTDRAGAAIAEGARGLLSLAAADLTGLRLPPPGGVVVLSDVTHPLLGAHGAAAVFGPQKGLTADEIPIVDAALARLAALLGADAALPGAGAAGGTGFALAAWGARLVPGAGEVAALIGLDEAVTEASLVVTGEGSYDGSSAAGKVPSFVASRAERAGVPVALVAGRIAPDADTRPFALAVSLSALAGDPRRAIADPARWLRVAGETLARAHGAGACV
ncbi:MAG: glycerate kinase [Microbacterium sp.]